MEDNNYTVVLKVPCKDKPDLYQCCYCELHSNVTRKYIWFGPKTINVSVKLIDTFHPEPMSKHDAELTVQIAYLTLRYLNPLVAIEPVSSKSKE